MKMFFVIHNKAKIDKERYKLPPKLHFIKDDSTIHNRRTKILFTCKHVLINITEIQ
jgi:hypothetical protein